MTRAVWVFLALLLSGAAGAQLDPKAQPFLDAYTASFENAKMPGFNGSTFATMDMTMCMTFYASPEPPSEESCTRTAMDITRRWMMTETSGEFSSKTVYRNGKAQTRIVGFGEPRELPPAQTKELERTLEAMFAQLQEIQNGTVDVESFTSSRYDGFVRYGKVLAGEKITATMVVPTFGLGQDSTQPTEIQLIFDKEETAIGMITSTPQSKSLIVYAAPLNKNPLARFMNATYYGLNGNKPVLQAKIRLARFRINAPLNEALFTLKPKP
jgi:hypothetical protein